MASSDIREAVKSKYGEAARRVKAGKQAGCGGGDSLIPCCDPISSNLYDAGETAGLPREAVSASLGCGNPTALAQLNAGEHVLDLGSGGGIDVLLSAERLITQFEITTSTEFSGSGIFSISPFRNSTFSTPALRWFSRASASISSVMSSP